MDSASQQPVLLAMSFASITGPMVIRSSFKLRFDGRSCNPSIRLRCLFPQRSLANQSDSISRPFSDVLQTCFASHYAWYVMAAGWGNPLVLRFTPWSLATIPPLAGYIAFIVQSFFCWRIWTLAQKRLIYIPLVGLISAISIGSCCVAFYTGILSGTMRGVAKADQLDKPITGWLSTSMAYDLFITITLVLQLYARRNKGFGSLNNVIHRAIRMSIETGAVTALSVTVELILYLQSNLTSWYFLLGMIVGKLYSNSLMANLNSRSPLLKNKNIGEDTGVHVWKKTDPLDIRVNTSTTTAIAPSDPSRIKSDFELGSLHDTRSRSAEDGTC